MPKTAAKARSVKSSHKAPKATVKKAAVARTSKKDMSMWDTYCAERDAFYRNHPNSQLLIGVLILVILIYLGLYFWSQASLLGWMM